jgi:hypothetical protein
MAEVGFSFERIDVMSKNGSAAAPPKASNKPVHEVRLGRIKAAIWANRSDSGVRHNVTVTRIYKDGEQWKDSASFGRDDLPLVAKVCDLAHSWIFQQGHGGGSSASGSGDEEGGEF